MLQYVLNDLNAATNKYFLLQILIFSVKYAQYDKVFRPTNNPKLKDIQLMI